MGLSDFGLHMDGIRIDVFSTFTRFGILGLHLFLYFIYFLMKQINEHALYNGNITIMPLHNNCRVFLTKKITLYLLSIFPRQLPHAKIMQLLPLCIRSNSGCTTSSFKFQAVQVSVFLPNKIAEKLRFNLYKFYLHQHFACAYVNYQIVYWSHCNFLAWSNKSTLKVIKNCKIKYV